ncbi:unnamed protein product [Bursaphelenchus xylophilus]|uniref:(pine wood nematode) hypothetical protein n=1 Tax=Bursaphelenchus xylophilus TaxID=6326 RepID=A0A1I7S570_BURXY|nr:unnamed protein product [Bursaphelenchus xylophilus]CAG9117766.1 unnamed protein product [Bursaphelenchus xylophilus]
MYKTVKDKKVPRWQTDLFWEEKGKIILAIVLLIFFGTICYLHYELHNRADWYTAKPEDRPFSDVMLTPKGNVELKEILCRRHQDHCYYITDLHLPHDKILRRLQQEPQQHTILGAGYVTSTGRLEQDILWAQYTRLALQGPFMFNVTGKNALQIGLGSGTSGAFLEHLGYKITSIELEPMIIHIAQKWFGVPGNSDHTVIEGDGFDYVVNRSTDEEKFDFAFIDTSYFDDLHLFISPVDIFTTSDFVKELRKHMNKECAVVLNTYSRHNELDKMLEAERHRHAMLMKYRKYFQTCFFIETSDNSLIFCSCKQTQKMTQIKYDYFLSHLPPHMYSKLVVDGNVREEW